MLRFGLKTVTPHISPILNQAYGLSLSQLHQRPHPFISLSVYTSLPLLPPPLFLLIFSQPSPPPFPRKRAGSEAQTSRRIIKDKGKADPPLVAPASSPPSEGKIKKKDPLLTNYTEAGGYAVLCAHKQQDRLKMLM